MSCNYFVYAQVEKTATDKLFEWLWGTIFSLYYLIFRSFALIMCVICIFQSVFFWWSLLEWTDGCVGLHVLHLWMSFRWVEAFRCNPSPILFLAVGMWQRCSVLLVADSWPRSFAQYLFFFLRERFSVRISLSATSLCCQAVLGLPAASQRPMKVSLAALLCFSCHSVSSFIRGA